jgi:hypothetical protein
MVRVGHLAPLDGVGSKVTGSDFIGMTCDLPHLRIAIVAKEATAHPGFEGEVSYSQFLPC